MPHARWVKLIEEQQQHGMDVEAFCRERDLGVASFRHHQSRMRKAERSGSGFVEVSTASGSGLRLLGGGWVLELEQDFDAETLRRFLAVAGR
jgi:hypothetical protein